MKRNMNRKLLKDPLKMEWDIALPMNLMKLLKRLKIKIKNLCCQTLKKLDLNKILLKIIIDKLKSRKITILNTNNILKLEINISNKFNLQLILKRKGLRRKSRNLIDILKRKICNHPQQNYLLSTMFEELKVHH